MHEILKVDADFTGTTATIIPISRGLFLILCGIFPMIVCAIATEYFSCIHKIDHHRQKL